MEILTALTEHNHQIVKIVEPISFEKVQLKKSEGDQIEYGPKDFDAMKTLFPSFTTIEWFQIASFMETQASVDLTILLSTVETDYKAQKDLDGKIKELFLEYLLETNSEVIRKANSEQTLPNKSIVKKEAECSICLETAQENEATSLFVCQHSFHLECIQQYIKIKIDERSFPITCPMEECCFKVFGSEIQKLLNEEDTRKYHTYSFEHFVDTHPKEIFRCPGVDCKSLAPRQDQKSFDCTACAKTYCMECSNEAHKGMTCKEYEITLRVDENDEMFKVLVEGDFCQKCSCCNFIVHKIDGCNHITCRCGHQFCYTCGLKWKTCRKCPQFGRRYPPQIIANNGYDFGDGGVLFEEGGIFGD